MTIREILHDEDDLRPSQVDQDKPYVIVAAGSALAEDESGGGPWALGKCPR